MAKIADVQEVSLSLLRPYERNAKIHGPQQIEKLKDSIREFGFLTPCLIDGDLNIIAGHGRVMAAKELGMETVPCVFIEGLTDAQRRAYILADNRLGELGEWDMELVNEELAALEVDGFDIQLTGFDFELDSFEVEEDNYAIPDTLPPKAKVGDVYLLGRHRVMCGDSTSVDDVQMLMGGAQADMLLTDPPYNVDYSGAAGKIKNDNQEDAKFRAFLSSAFFAAKSAMKQGAAFHIWHAETEGYNFRGACSDAGLTCRQQLIWVKSSQTLGRQDFQRMYEGVLTGDTFVDEEMDDNGYEPCLYGWKDGKGHKWYKKRKEKDVLFFDKPVSSKEHPTMKPVKLFDYEMRCNTQPGDIVLDVFAGSGTTIIAAEQNGRAAFCMELDPKFVDVIIDRWEQFTGGKAVLLNG